MQSSAFIYRSSNLFSSCQLEPINSLKNSGLHSLQSITCVRTGCPVLRKLRNVHGCSLWTYLKCLIRSSLKSRSYLLLSTVFYREFNLIMVSLNFLIYFRNDCLEINSFRGTSAHSSFFTLLELTGFVIFLLFSSYQIYVNLY